MEDVNKIIILDSTRKSTDWFSQLKDDEIEKDKSSGKTLVLLKGLRRLADVAGKTREEIKFGNAFSLPKGGYFAQVAYSAEFSDGTVWVGTADTNPENCENLANYPTAVAESRAEARALRKALSIANLAKEEINNTKSIAVSIDDEEEKPIESVQLILINRLMTQHGLQPIDVLKKVTKRDVVELKELTWSEGQEASRWLNQYKAKKK